MKSVQCIFARLSQGVPPPPAAFASPPGSTYSASPRSSYAGLPPPAARPPPPYRAPPLDPVQSRPLPSRPSESALTSPPPAPPKRSAAAGNNVPPMLPPVAISSSPPPLPRRHPSDVGSVPPRDRSNSQDPSSSSTRISDSQQPSPTDSGFTEDSKSFSEPLGHGRSKSYGNLTVEREDEVLTQAVSLDQVSESGFAWKELKDQFSTQSIKSAITVSCSWIACPPRQVWKMHTQSLSRKEQRHSTGLKI